MIVNVPVGAKEKTYRVFVEELPPPDLKKQNMGVRVLTKISIPVFFTPDGATHQLAVEGLTVAKGKFVFHLKNNGNRYAQVQSIDAIGKGESGDVFKGEAKSWYVLAGDDRVYELPVPADQCSKIKELSVTAKVQEKTVSAKQPAPAGGCTP